jgi:hypothetical protein
MNNFSIQRTERKNLVKPVLIAGLTAGTLDAIGAIVVYQANPFLMFQFIASGAIGHEQAFQGGWTTALLGLCFHYFIACCWTTLFFLAFPRIEKFKINKLILGIIYGAIVWTGMNLVILPLSQIPQRHLAFMQILIGMSILIVMIGIPVSLFAHRFYTHKS